MSAALEYLQYRNVKRIRTGLGSIIEIAQGEAEILNHPDLTAIVAARVKENPRRNIRFIPPWTPDYVPGVLRKVLIEKKNGDMRTTWSSNDPDYAIGLRMYYGLAIPLVHEYIDENTHGFVPGRGTESAIGSITNTIYNLQGDIAVVQEDIQDCFPTIRVMGLIDKIAPGLLADYIKLLHYRYTEADRTANHLGSGLPQGHPVSPVAMALIIDHVLRPIRHKWSHHARLKIYADDITILTRTIAEGTQIRGEMSQALAAYGIKLNPKKARTAIVRDGESFECLGYKLEWDRTAGRLMICPKDGAYRQLTEKIAAAENRTQAKRIEVGWINAYRLTNTPDHKFRTLEAIRDAHRLTATPTTHH